MLRLVECVPAVRRAMRSLLPLVPAAVLLSLLVTASPPAHAGTAQATDELVQSDQSGGNEVVGEAGLTGVSLSFRYDSSGYFYGKGVDVAIYRGSALVKEVDGIDAAGAKVGLGAVTNYDYDPGSPVVYAIKYRGHYGLVGASVQNLTEDWQSSGLYFTVYRVAVIPTGGGGPPQYPATGDVFADNGVWNGIQLTFSKPLNNPGDYTDATDVQVYVDGKPDTVTGFGYDSSNDDELLVFLTTNVTAGQTVTLSYDGSTWKYADKSLVPDFSGLPVTNNVGD